MYRTLGSLTALKLIGALLGIFYSILQVKYFGTDRVIETFFAAQSLVYLVTSLTQSGQLAEVYLPVFLELKENYNLSIASHSFSSVINKVVVFVSLILVVMFLLAPLLMELFIPGFTESDQLFATTIFRCFLPLVLLQIVSSFINTVLNAEKIYGRVEVAGILSYFVSIALLVLFYSDLSIWVLVIALYAGKCIDLMIGLYYLQKKEIKYSLIWDVEEFDAKELFKTLLSTFRYTGATQVLNWAYTASLSFLPQGLFAIYKYVNLLFSKSGSIIIDPIKTLLFTEFSTNRKSNKEAIVKLLKSSITSSILIGTLVFALALFGGYEGLSLIWGGSKFDLEKLDQAFPILIAFFSLYIVQIAYGIARKYTVSIGQAKQLYNWQAWTQLISAAVVYLCISFFSYWGLILGVIINRLLLISVPFIMNRNIYIEVFKLKFIAKWCLLLAVLVVTFWWTNGQYIDAMNGVINRTNDLVGLLLFSSIALVLFLVAASVLSFDEMQLLCKSLKSRFNDR